MFKHTKIILILGGLSLFLFFYIVLSVRQVTVTSENSTPVAEVDYEKNEVEKISQEQIRVNYQVSINDFWSDYEKILKKVKDLSFNLIDEKEIDKLSTTTNKLEESLVSDYEEKIVKLRIEAMSYTVPAQYKDMHLKMVMSLSSLKNYLDTQADEHKEQALSLYMEAKNEYQNL